jgi:hypothetical protein
MSQAILEEGFHAMLKSIAWEAYGEAVIHLGTL